MLRNFSESSKQKTKKRMGMMKDKELEWGVLGFAFGWCLFGLCHVGSRCFVWCVCGHVLLSLLHCTTRNKIPGYQYDCPMSLSCWTLSANPPYSSGKAGVLVWNHLTRKFLKGWKFKLQRLDCWADDVFSGGVGAGKANWRPRSSPVPCPTAARGAGHVVDSDILGPLRISLPLSV